MLHFAQIQQRWAWGPRYGQVQEGFYRSCSCMLCSCVKPRYQSHGIGKGYSGGYHEYFGPDADIDSPLAANVTAACELSSFET